MSSIGLEGAYELDPRVSLRPEPFGALAYHFDNRRLSFLRSHEMVAVVRSLGSYDTLAEALAAAGVGPVRWPAFLRALERLAASDMIRTRDIGSAADVA